MANTSSSTQTPSASLTSEEIINNIPKQQIEMVKKLSPLCSKLIELEGLSAGKVAENNAKMLSNGSNKLDSDSAPIVHQLREFVAAMDCDLLQFERIDPKRIRATTFCRPIHEQQDLFEMSIFGFRYTGHRIPLHDHPQMFGFIRPLIGRCRISSYTWLDGNDEQNLRTQMPAEFLDANSAAAAQNGDAIRRGRNVRPALYAGQLIMSAPPKNCPANVAILEPKSRNVHTIEALEDGAAFFDLLVPGYHSEERICTYYNVLEEGKKDPKIGDIVWLESNGDDDDIPEHFTMQRI